MNVCEKCKHLNRYTKMCEFWREPACAHNACCGFAVKTNADRIRAMSDEELAIFMCSNGWRTISQKECCLKWLQQPAEEADK